MQRLIEIKSRLDVIGAALEDMKERYRADPDISAWVTGLKDYVETELKKIRKQAKAGKLTEFEECFIAPAIQDVYTSDMDKIRRGSKPGSKMHDHIRETSTSLSYWLFEIEAYESQKEQ
ncbi:hypothetical protein [Pantoea agglomerans]|uniref:hypothetical protein n=1 Tax=Enterobacter agglomerans TaxID=549 RepID=UPI003C7D686D